jgi:sensor histidine kinase YesM
MKKRFDFDKEKFKRIPWTAVAIIFAAALVASVIVWQGGVLSVCALLLIVLASVAIIWWESRKRVKAILEAQRIEAEKQAMERKIQDSQISIMLSQIQPHFLYNTLNSIYQLCETNPMRARSMVNLFSEYLRNNLSSLDEQELVELETELAHVKTYLDIEKVRFEDTLEIEYDIKCVDFSLPVLTVQPIVENAVKHGTSKKRGGGKVIISTTEDKDHYVISVSDTGVGFDAASPKNDGKHHMGIENVRQRLSNMCNGSLSIESKVGEGTLAIIKIPKVRKNENYSRR